MTKARSIPATLIDGDGIGPEITDATLTVLEALGSPFVWSRHKAGVAAMEESGDVLPETTLADIQRTKLALKAPLETPIGKGFHSVTVRLRKQFNLYANVRPAHTYISGGHFGEIDLILVRENTEGLYVNAEHYVPIDNDPHAVAVASGFMTRSGCRKIAKFTFDYAVKHGRKKVTIVHKANILKKLTGLFLDTALEVGKAYQDRLDIEERIVDNTAMQLVINPSQFDVILTSNMFGDILSDEIAGIVGGLGIAPGANIGADLAIFEAVHGTAPDIVGQGIANPTSLLLSSAMMLDYVDERHQAQRLRNAIKQVLNDDNVKTHDLGGVATTAQYTEAIINRLR